MTRPLLAADLPLVRRTILGAVAFFALIVGFPVAAYAMGNLAPLALIVCLLSPVGLLAFFGWNNWFVGAAFLWRGGIEKDRAALDLEAAARFATRYALAYHIDAKLVEARIAVDRHGFRPVVDLVGDGRRTLMDEEASLAFAHAVSPQGLLAFLIGGAIAVPLALEESSAHLRLGAQQAVAQARADVAALLAPMPWFPRAMLRLFPGMLS